jgi:excisionase family DNA binding protein
MIELSEQKKPIAISLDEAAASVGVEVKTIRREVQRGRLRASKVGRRIVVLQSDFLAYLDRNVVNEGVKK